MRVIEGTIPTCENPLTRAGTKPGWPWWEVSGLTARPPRSPIPKESYMKDDADGPLVFSGISRYPLSFRYCYVLTSITIIGSQDLAPLAAVNPLGTDVKRVAGKPGARNFGDCANSRELHEVEKREASLREEIAHLSEQPPLIELVEKLKLENPAHLRKILKRDETSRLTCKRVHTVQKLLTSHLGEPGSIPGGVAPEFSHVEIVLGDATSWRVFSGSPVSHALSFRLCSILTSFYSHRLPRPRWVFASQGKGGRGGIAEEESNPQDKLWTWHKLGLHRVHYSHQAMRGPLIVSIDLLGVSHLLSDNGAALECKRGCEIPEKTCRPAASSGTIPACENPGVTRPGIEPGSPCYLRSCPNDQSLHPQFDIVLLEFYIVLRSSPVATVRRIAKECRFPRMHYQRSGQRKPRTEPP
ncbi:hypothetical protein PR048_028144 [Dryococelus australis]|uniref:Uncharacterized protein n=1 Tax=Dryococelus australis TaxID=614101 RepID=A0ABQ9GIH5_9NEOP|nr:hypothetical protein PR048_028144 [Dryococelus australis]